MPAVRPPSVYELGGPSTRRGLSMLLMCGPISCPLKHPGLQISDMLEVDARITIGEMGLWFYAIEGQALQAAVQQRDSQIQQLQTTVFEMSSRESTLMQCILGMDRRLADLERRPPGPQ
ncbi:hypothetical protein Tco_0899014 [Tanacetum coccineum]